jgi:hypothetical protein
VTFGHTLKYFSLLSWELQPNALKVAEDERELAAKAEALQAQLASLDRDALNIQQSKEDIAQGKMLDCVRHHVQSQKMSEKGVQNVSKF